MNDFDILELQGELGENTREDWKDQLDDFTDDEDLMLKSMYLSKLKYALDEETDAIFYGLKHQENNHACAILELTVKMPETSYTGLRLLNITLEPNLDVENRHADKLDTESAIGVIVQCIVEAFSLTFQEIPAQTFKIYGRTDRMKLILENVAKSINNSDKLSPFFDTEIQGRWLLIAKKQ